MITGFVLLFYFWPTDPVSRETWQRIEIGMNLAEVEDLLGIPSISTNELELVEFGEGRIYWAFQDPQACLVEGIDLPNDEDTPRVRWWYGPYTAIAVVLNDDGLVIGKSFRQYPGLSFAEQFRRKLRWR